MILNEIVGYHVGALIQLSVRQCPLGVEAFTDCCRVWIRRGSCSECVCDSLMRKWNCWSLSIFIEENLVPLGQR